MTGPAVAQCSSQQRPTCMYSVCGELRCGAGNDGATDILGPDVCHDMRRPKPGPPSCGPLPERQRATFGAGGALGVPRMPRTSNDAFVDSSPAAPHADPTLGVPFAAQLHAPGHAAAPSGTPSLVDSGLHAVDTGYSAVDADPTLGVRNPWRMTRDYLTRGP
jgi:hypothetical protein